MSDDLWDDDSTPEPTPLHPQGLPTGVTGIQLSPVDPGKREQRMRCYGAIAARPITMETAPIAATALAELQEYADVDGQDVAMGSLGVAADSLGFHAEVIKLMAKFEADAVLENVLPDGLHELITVTTEMPEAVATLFEMAFLTGYKLGKSGELDRDHDG